MTENQKKLLDLLKEMFQFDQADLDFGIYRIMNMKREEVSDFLNNKLMSQISEGIHSLVDTGNEAKIAEIKSQIDSVKALPIPEAAKAATIATLDSQLAALSGSDISDVEADVYNHLINFFSRYYDEGDFISQRRYKDGVYAIPYEGEEVKLHWANADQYYVKTAEYFNDYTFKDSYGTKTVTFKIVDAETERDNNKASEKKFFCLCESNPYEVSEDGSALTVFVEYRASDDCKKQDDASQKIYDYMKSQFFMNGEWAHLFVQPSAKEKSEFERHLFRYTAKNTYDYFIHKDLGKFLRQELDFYIKNEVIYLDDITVSDMAKTKEYLVKAQVIKAVAGKIIDFLAQIEDFQKKLYLKKKFVVDTQYCITLDRIPVEFYPEIIANDAQREEWVKLFAIDEIEEDQGDILSGPKVGYSVPLTLDFLKQNQFLVLDTAFFDVGFKEKLIDMLDDLDSSIDGVLFNGDNFQMLNLIKYRYSHSIACIYIDPPYNAQSSEILYKNNYKHSSWLSMMKQRIDASQNLMSDDCCLNIAIDDYEVIPMSQMLDDTLTAYERNMIVVNHHPQGTPKDNVSRTHEYAVVMTPSGEGVMGHTENNDVSYRAYMRSGTADNNFRWGRPNSFYAVLVDEQTKSIMGVEPPPTLGAEYPRENTPEGWRRIYPFSQDGTERVWRWSFNSPELRRENLNEVLRSSNTYTLYQIVSKKKPPINSNWIDKRYNAGTYGTTMIKDMMGDSSFFSYPKSLYTVEDYIKAVVGEDEQSLVLDYFAGSATTGHAVIDLNRNSETNYDLSYILCEMGYYFDTVTLPRIEKSIYSNKWNLGKPVDRNGVSQVVKYLRLESYEDTLNNISFDTSSMDFLPSEMRDEYVLKYMMETESQKSLFNVESFAHPFNYAMSITRKQESKWTNVDLVETFNYLIGLVVERSYAKTSYDATFSEGEYGVLKARISKGNTYTVKLVEGHTLSGDKVLVIWRDMTGDTEKDNAVLTAILERRGIDTKDKEYDRIYVNGDNNLPNLNGNTVFLIEDEMQARMFEEN